MTLYWMAEAREARVQSPAQDSCPDSALESLNQDLVRVEEEIESVFARLPPVEAAHIATARLRQYETKLQEASSLFIRSRMGMDPHR